MGKYVCPIVQTMLQYIGFHKLGYANFADVSGVLGLLARIQASPSLFINVLQD